MPPSGGIFHVVTRSAQQNRVRRGWCGLVFILSFAPPCLVAQLEWCFNMGNNQPIYLTAEGLQKVKEELEYLTTVRRREVAQMIAEAKAEGDISENAGYDEAKTAQGFLEGKIRELEAVVSQAQVIQQNAGSTHHVTLGKTVIVREAGTDDEETFTIVGSREADPGKKRISNESPMGKALMGKAVGERAEVSTPGGTIEFEILDIH
jgi:transcription elongation factor GreA